MYNRYIRNDDGVYTRIPQEDRQQSPPPRQEAPPHADAQRQQQPPPHTPPPPPPRPSPGGSGHQAADGLTGFLRHILDQLHLEHVDTGDLLLLVLLFFLSREDADEELLVALGLLLIL